MAGSQAQRIYHGQGAVSDFSPQLILIKIYSSPVSPLSAALPSAQHTSTTLAFAIYPINLFLSMKALATVARRIEAEHGPSRGNVRCARLFLSEGNGMQYFSL
jgi:hypothetical protein